MAPRPLSPLVLALGGAAAVLGSVLFILWKTYFGSGRERRWDGGEAWWGAEPAGLPQWDEWDPEDEEDVEPALEELEQREVLVLGLDGSGKSTFLRVLAGKPPLEGHIPTWGFNSVRLPTRDFEVDLLEIGGSQNLRFYWKEFVNEVDVLVFMVDSADRLRLPWARQELHKLLDKDPDLPVVVVANKQVRAVGGWPRSAGLDPRCLGPGAPEGFGPRPVACGTRLTGTPTATWAASSFLTPHPLCLPLCLPVICHPGRMRKIISLCPLCLRCGFK
ncbi:ADP-ribosylation factor-like protein 10 isoform X1 [Cervus canadensis]|uniref:ADP-ribosylation factor-like protein 10 isoform X1 n=1 Tax=Cervus canadensis TaxID=1574408 RepID=UPI001C9E66C8|nr:ADP-ribosylation factor-like protein 10 isoform X1 [Cervus canadensis]